MTTKAIVAETEAQRELAELNALHIEQALIQARIAAAIDRLLDTDAETLRVSSIDGRDALLPGSHVHVLHEVWTDGRRDAMSAHDADTCHFRWCSNPIGEVVTAERARGSVPGIGFAFEGTWLLAAYDGRDAVLVREVAR